MARQAGPIYFIGTLGNITFYQMKGVYYARMKSSLNRQRFLTDPRFARSRASALTFGECSRLASQVYWSLPTALHGKGVVNKMTGIVSGLVRQGKSEAEVVVLLLQAMGVQVVKEAGKSGSQTTKGKSGGTRTRPNKSASMVQAVHAEGVPGVEPQVLSRWWVSKQGTLYQETGAGCLLPPAPCPLAHRHRAPGKETRLEPK